uniref:CSON005999 protein n=1 Tax=Culicoides sonorensis TaxID=179676 RepID=A0A336LJC3_CULSO
MTLSTCLQCLTHTVKALRFRSCTLDLHITEMGTYRGLIKWTIYEKVGQINRHVLYTNEMINCAGNVSVQDAYGKFIQTVGKIYEEITKRWMKLDCVNIFYKVGDQIWINNHESFYCFIMLASQMLKPPLEITLKNSQDESAFQNTMVCNDCGVKLVCHQCHAGYPKIQIPVVEVEEIGEDVVDVPDDEPLIEQESFDRQIQSKDVSPESQKLDDQPIESNENSFNPRKSSSEWSEFSLEQPTSDENDNIAFEPLNNVEHYEHPEEVKENLILAEELKSMNLNENLENHDEKEPKVESHENHQVLIKEVENSVDKNYSTLNENDVEPSKNSDLQNIVEFVISQTPNDWSEYTVEDLKSDKAVQNEVKSTKTFTNETELQPNHQNTVPSIMNGEFTDSFNINEQVVEHDEPEFDYQEPFNKTVNQSKWSTNVNCDISIDSSKSNGTVVELNEPKPFAKHSFSRNNTKFRRPRPGYLDLDQPSYDEINQFNNVDWKSASPTAMTIKKMNDLMIIKSAEYAENEKFEFNNRNSKSDEGKLADGNDEAEKDAVKIKAKALKRITIPRPIRTLN